MQVRSCGGEVGTVSKKRRYSRPPTSDLGKFGVGLVGGRRGGVNFRLKRRGIFASFDQLTNFCTQTLSRGTRLVPRNDERGATSTQGANCGNSVKQLGTGATRPKVRQYKFGDLCHQSRFEREPCG